MSSRGIDIAVLDDDIAAGQILTAANACGIAVAAGVERTGAHDGQRLALGDVDAGIGAIESLHIVCAHEDDGGIAQAVETRPPIRIFVIIVPAVDGDVVERHGGPVGNADLRGRVERAGECLAVLCHIVAGHAAEVASTGIGLAAATCIRVVVAAAARAVVGIFEDGPLRADVEVVLPIEHVESEYLDLGPGLAADARLGLDVGVNVVGT